MVARCKSCLIAQGFTYMLYGDAKMSHVGKSRGICGNRGAYELGATDSYGQVLTPLAGEGLSQGYVLRACWPRCISCAWIPASYVCPV